MKNVFVCTCPYCEQGIENEFDAKPKIKAGTADLKVRVIWADGKVDILRWDRLRG